MNLKDALVEALQRNGETLDDLVVCSHPLEILTAIATLEEIQCFYLNSASGYDVSDPVDKQDMPFIAMSSAYIYYSDHNTVIENPEYTYDKTWEELQGLERYVQGVASYPIDDKDMKRSGTVYTTSGTDFREELIEDAETKVKNGRETTG